MKTNKKKISVSEYLKKSEVALNHIQSIKESELELAKSLTLKLLKSHTEILFKVNKDIIEAKYSGVTE